MIKTKRSTCRRKMKMTRRRYANEETVESRNFKLKHVVTGQRPQSPRNSSVISFSCATLFSSMKIEYSTFIIWIKPYEIVIELIGTSGNAVVIGMGRWSGIPLSLVSPQKVWCIFLPFQRPRGCFFHFSGLRSYRGEDDWCSTPILINSMKCSR